jgi:hypothetical protein
MSCEQALLLLYDLADSEIARDDAVWLAVHLASCRACAEKLLALQRVDSVLAERMTIAPPYGLAERIVESAENERVVRRRDALWVGLAALIAAACLALTFSGGRGAPDTVAASIWERGSLIAHSFATLPSDGPRELIERASGLPEALAHLWPGSSPSAGSPTLLAVMVALQLLGSLWFLTFQKSRRREASAP